MDPTVSIKGEQPAAYISMLAAFAIGVSADTASTQSLMQTPDAYLGTLPGKDDATVKSMAADLHAVVAAAPTYVVGCKLLLQYGTLISETLAKAASGPLGIAAAAGALEL